MDVDQEDDEYENDIGKFLDGKLGKPEAKSGKDVRQRRKPQKNYVETGSESDELPDWPAAIGKSSKLKAAKKRIVKDSSDEATEDDYNTDDSFIDSFIDDSGVDVGDRIKRKGRSRRKEPLEESEAEETTEDEAQVAGLSGDEDDEPFQKRLSKDEKGKGKAQPFSPSKGAIDLVSLGKFIPSTKVRGVILNLFCLLTGFFVAPCRRQDSRICSKGGQIYAH